MELKQFAYAIANELLEKAYDKTKNFRPARC